MKTKSSQYESLELYSEPLKIHEILPKDMRKREMSDYQQSFLCGMIKKYRPQNIVEIGVSAGGTSAIILMCMKLLGMDDACLTSVDLSEKYYRDETKSVGFIGEYTAEKLGITNYSIKCGNVIATFLDSILEEKGPIDCLILDTMHSLPGEALDYLCCLPYMKKGGVVVMHDVVLNLYELNHSFATGLIFSSVSGKKYYQYDKDEQELSNIAAFEVTDETKENTDDIFQLLSATWEYMPDEQHLKTYMGILDRHYARYQMEAFGRTIDRQRVQLDYRIPRNDVGEFLFTRMVEKLCGEKVMLYGAGHYGKALYKALTDNGVEVPLILVSNGERIDDSVKKGFSCPIKSVDEFEDKLPKIPCIIAIKNSMTAMNIRRHLIEIGCIVLDY